MTERQLLAVNDKNRFIWFVLAIAIAIGIFFRFYNLDKKIFWLDETLTANELCGNPYGWYRLLKTENTIEIKKLQNFQAPSDSLGLKDSIQALIEMEPSHAPLFLSLLYFWAKCVGHSTFQMRLLPALFSLLQIPAIIWLCFELSGTLYLGMMAAAFLSLSPILVAYAQETREYSLFALASIILSACFLRAVRKQDLSSWIAYSLALLFSLYASLLTFLVVAGQIIYLLLQKGLKSKQFRSFLAAFFCSFVAYLPWLGVVWQHLERGSQGLQWLLNPTPLLYLLSIWNANFAGAFFDLGNLDPPYQVLMAAFVMLELYAAVAMYRKSTRVAKFLLTLIATSTLPFMILDLFAGSRCSIPPRYQTAATTGLSIVVAYLFYIKLRDKTDKLQIAWRLLLPTLLISEVVSCTILSQAVTWREKPLGGDLLILTRIMNTEAIPPTLVINEDKTNNNARQFLVASHMLNPNAKALMLREPAIPRLDNGTTHFYTYNLAPNYRQYLENTGRFKFSQIGKIAKLQRVDCKALPN